MTTDFTKCIKYYKNTTENLSEGSSQWIQRFCDAASIHNDEIYVHIKSEMPAMVNHEETQIAIRATPVSTIWKQTSSSIQKVIQLKAYWPRNVILVSIPVKL